MLVLQRTPNESVILQHRVTGERITCTITRVRGDRVRLGIEAPMDWKILRDELEDGMTPKDTA